MAPQPGFQQDFFDAVKNFLYSVRKTFSMPAHDQGFYNDVALGAGLGGALGGATMGIPGAIGGAILGGLGGANMNTYSDGVPKIPNLERIERRRGANPVYGPDEQRYTNNYMQQQPVPPAPPFYPSRPMPMPMPPTPPKRFTEQEFAFFLKDAQDRNMSANASKQTQEPQAAFKDVNPDYGPDEQRYGKKYKYVPPAPPRPKYVSEQEFAFTLKNAQNKQMAANTSRQVREGKLESKSKSKTENKTQSKPPLDSYIKRYKRD